MKKWFIGILCVLLAGLITANVVSLARKSPGGETLKAEEADSQEEILTTEEVVTEHLVFEEELYRLQEECDYSHFQTNASGQTFGSEGMVTLLHDRMIETRRETFREKYPEAYDTIMGWCQESVDGKEGNPFHWEELDVDWDELRFYPWESGSAFSLVDGKAVDFDFEFTMKEWYDLYPDLVYANFDYAGQRLCGYMYKDDYLIIEWNDGDPNCILEYPVYHREEKPGETIEFPVYASDGKTVTSHFSYVVPGAEDPNAITGNTFCIDDKGVAQASADLITYLREVEGIEKVDLVEVKGDNGIRGYIRQSEIGSDIVSQIGLEYFLKYQAKPGVYNVYQDFGETVVDTLTIE